MLTDWSLAHFRHVAFRNHGPSGKTFAAVLAVLAVFLPQHLQSILQQPCRS